MSEYIKHVEDLLCAWGYVARQYEIDRGYKPTFLAISHGYRDPPSNRLHLSISEEDYFAVDAAVSSLELVNPVLKEVAKRSYMRKQSSRYIAKKIQSQKDGVCQYRSAVVSFVAGALANCISNQRGGRPRNSW